MYRGGALPPSLCTLYIPPKGLNTIYRPHNTHPTLQHGTFYGVDHQKLMDGSVASSSDPKEVYLEEKHVTLS